jgi:hypothetical protein
MNQLKYNILQLIDQKIPGSKQGCAINHICTILNIHRNTFNNWCKIKIEDKADIPHNQVVILAYLLECEVEDLENSPPILIDLQPISKIINVPIIKTTKTRLQELSKKHKLSL